MKTKDYLTKDMKKLNNLKTKYTKRQLHHKLPHTNFQSYAKKQK